MGEKGTRVSTVYTYYNKLMVFFRWLEMNGHIEKGALTKRITPPSRPEYNDSKALSENKIARIQASIAMYRMNDNFLLKRDTLILSLLLYTGIRKGELLALRMGDIDWSNRCIHINGATSKSKKSRNIPLNPMLLLHLKTYLQDLKERKVKSEYLLLASRTYTKFTEHGIKHWVNLYKERSGIRFHLISSDIPLQRHLQKPMPTFQVLKSLWDTVV